MSPYLSVLLPVHNGERFLSDALDSVLQQTYTDFELLILDDGSNDNSSSIARAYAKKDARLQLHQQSQSGLAATLNRGIDLAQGKYVVRMDADDISLPGRFAAQTKFMDTNPSVGICGTSVQTFGYGQSELWKYPVNDELIRCTLLFQTPFAHPSVMIRKSVLDQHHLRYDTRFARAQDYALWITLSEYCAMANLPDVLLKYRRHHAQVTETDRGTQLVAVQNARRMIFTQLGINPTEAMLNIHESISELTLEPNMREIEQAEEWLTRLLMQNELHARYPRRTFANVLSHRWYLICQQSAKLGLPLWESYVRSILSRRSLASWKRKLFLLVLCLKEATHANTTT